MMRQQQDARLDDADGIFDRAFAGACRKSDEAVVLGELAETGVEPDLPAIRPDEAGLAVVDDPAPGHGPACPQFGASQSGAPNSMLVLPFREAAG